MTILRINNADLPTGWIHERTDWQVSDTIDFSNIVLESLDDSVNLTTKIFNTRLDLDVKYYGRARMLLNNGFTEWSNIDIFTPRDANDVALINDIPSIITPPLLTTNFDKNAHPSAYFKLIGNEFDTLGNSSHESTTWLIEDSDGNAIWFKSNDTKNLTEILVDKYLPLHKLYRASVFYTSTNGDTSQLTTISFYTSNDNLVALNTTLTGIDSSIDLEIELPYMDGLDVLDWEFYSDENSVVTSASSDNTFTILSQYITPGVIHILRVRATINSNVGEWTYIYVIPRDTNFDYIIGDNLPYSEGNALIRFPLKLPFKFMPYNT